MAIGATRSVETNVNYDALGPDEVYKIGACPSDKPGRYSVNQVLTISAMQDEP